jgi:hypothetical protein
MSLLHDVEAVLITAGYETRLASEPKGSVYFEDDSIFGFCVTYPSVADLLANWLGNQERFLVTNAPSLRRANQKAWNCYAVHLTQPRPADEEVRQLFDIEEDFRSTRKIARAGIASASDLMRALYPLLPIQNVVRIRGGDSTKDLAERLHWPAGAVRALLGRGVPSDILDLLLEDK